MAITELLARLVTINSVNPSLVVDAPGEREITNFVNAWLVNHGVTVSEVSSSQPADRPSLLCQIKGTDHGKSLMLYAHTDTVGVEGMRAPFVARIVDGALHGRGAYDMKASLAAILHIAAEVVARPCAGDVPRLSAHALAGAAFVRSRVIRISRNEAQVIRYDLMRDGA